MNAKLFMLLGVGLPVCCSFLTLFFKKQVKEIFAIAIGAATAVLVSMLISPVLQGNIIEFRRNLFMGFGLYLRADVLSVFFALFVSVAGTIILFYSADFMKNDASRPEFYVIGLLLIGLSLGIVFSANLILLFIFWVLSAVCCWRLSVLNGAGQDNKAANKTLIMLFITSVIMLAGFIMVHFSRGTFGIPELRGVQVSSYALFFIFIGIMAKAYIFPLYAWFTDSGISPSPAMALLGSAAVVNMGIYVFTRLFCQTFQVPEYFKVVIASLALISAFIAGCSAMAEKNIRKILAYAAVSQAGLVITSLALYSEISLTGALLFVLANALAMTGLILCAGIVEQKTGATEINKLGGLVKNMPVTAVLFAVCAMSVAGVPPMLGFWGGFLTVVSAMKDGFLALGVIHIICAILTILYLLRLFAGIFLGNKISNPQAKEDAPLMLAGVSMLVFLLVVCGLFIQWPTSIVEIAKQQILFIKP